MKSYEPSYSLNLYFRGYFESFLFPTHSKYLDFKTYDFIHFERITSININSFENSTIHFVFKMNLILLNNSFQTLETKDLY